MDSSAVGIAKLAHTAGEFVKGGDIRLFPNDFGENFCFP